MTYYIGLDISIESTAVCVIEAVGCVKKEFSARSHPEDLANALDPFSDEIGGIGLEAGPMSGFLVEGLSQRGLDSVLMERRRVHAGVAADLVTMAKGLAGDFPLSAVTGRSEIVDAAPVGGIGGTYAGNPLAVAAANAVLDVIEEEDLCTRATVIGNRIKARLNEIASRQGMEAIGDVRGLGAMLAFELVTDRDSNAPDAALTVAIVAEAEARGLIILPCGTRANAVRLLPPLTTPMDQIDEALEILEASIEAAIK